MPVNNSHNASAASCNPQRTHSIASHDQKKRNLLRVTQSTSPITQNKTAATAAVHTVRVVHTVQVVHMRVVHTVQAVHMQVVHIVAEHSALVEQQRWCWSGAGCSRSSTSQKDRRRIRERIQCTIGGPVHGMSGRVHWQSAQVYTFYTPFCAPRK